MTHLTRRTAHALLAGTAVLAVAALAAFPAEAQTLTDPAGPLTGVSEASIVPSEADLTRMADDLAREATLLADDDSRKPATLRLAGRYYHHAGELEASRRALIDAGRAYYRIGEHRLSSHAFLDASQVAGEAGDARAALAAADMAGAVLRLAELSREERDEILSRVSYLDREMTTPSWPGEPDA